MVLLRTALSCLAFLSVLGCSSASDTLPDASADGGPTAEGGTATADGGSATTDGGASTLDAAMFGSDASTDAGRVVERPNLPAGLVEIASFDGCVEEVDGHAFGIEDFGAFREGGSDNIAVVDDATNPVGSGCALRFRYVDGDNPLAGIATANTFSGGPYSEIYILIRLYYEPGWSGGHKHFYLGASTDSRSQGAGNPTQFYATREGDGRERFINQNVGSVELIDSTDPPPGGSSSTPWTDGVWHMVEYHLTQSSAPGAADGSIRVYFDGALLGENESVAWTGPSHGSVGFSGMEWYADANSIPATSEYRLGELYIAGR